MTIEEIQQRLAETDIELEETMLLLRIRQLHAELAQAEYNYAKFKVEHGNR